MDVTVAHICDRSGHWRAGAFCGQCQSPCTPRCAGCGHDLTQPGHEGGC